MYIRDIDKKKNGDDVLKKLVALCLDVPASHPEYHTDWTRKMRRLEKIPPIYKRELSKKGEELLNELEKLISNPQNKPNKS